MLKGLGYFRFSFDLVLNLKEKTGKVFWPLPVLKWACYHVSITCSSLLIDILYGCLFHGVEAGHDFFPIGKNYPFFFEEIDQIGIGKNL
ncbi:hypothetical protein LV92_02715 [Arenibacter echinorum]|uniref:Uncharacterized protein n=1 Tax=Arenibacter echinorum TaxID=440515 RepID=A0A327QZB2_9FLAO|nr:hypothetical protein LV92_02715 [Arenibacter echinorum]